MASELNRLYGYDIIVEPEESEWPDVIGKKDLLGHFTMWMAFRQMWIPQQYEAQELKNRNRTVFLDSYFIKIIGYELDKPGMGWLFPKEDPYFDVYNQLCKLDIEHLPDPDCIVLFDINFDDWIKLLATRDRDWDKTPGFVESYEHTKSAIQEAVQQLCEDRNIRLVHFKQEFGDISKQAERLRAVLVSESVFRD